MTSVVTTPDFVIVFVDAEIVSMESFVTVLPGSVAIFTGNVTVFVTVFLGAVRVEYLTLVMYAVVRAKSVFVLDSVSVVCSTLVFVKTSVAVARI